MNTPQQVSAVKDIIRIKNKILHCTDWDEIAGLIQEAIDCCITVPANSQVDTLDRTKTKEWNVLAVRKMGEAVQHRRFPSLEAAYPEVATSLLRLSMVFVKNGLDDVNKILKESFLRKGLFQPASQKQALKRS